MKSSSFTQGLFVGALACFIGLSSFGFTPNNPHVSDLMNEDGTLNVRLSDEDVKRISDNVLDDDYIIRRVLFCIDGSSIYDGTISTYCNN